MAGIIIPHESQAGIRTASGGSGGQYRSARDFMTPGQENLGRGMQQLAAGMEKLGGVMFDAEIKKRQEQLDLKAMEAVQNAFMQNEEWLANYQDQYHGPDAFNAVNDYAASSQKVADELTASFQHNPRALEYVTSRIGSMRQGGTKTMRKYAEDQEKVYQSSLVTQQKSILSSVYADPNKTPEERAQAARDYTTFRHNQLVNQGWDQQAASTAVSDEIRSFDKGLERNRHAIVRQKNPELAASISRAGVEGKVHVDPVAFVAGKESGPEGSLAIGYDRTGGTSYGKFQISSSTMESSFIPWLKENGHTAVADELSNAGPANTGGRGGPMADVWKSLVQSGAVTDEMQEQFIRETHLDPAMKGAPEGLRQSVASDAILEAAALSTAVQHGAVNARKILSEAWETSGGDKNLLLAALYEERKARFSSSTPEVQRAMSERMNAERDELFRAGNAVLEPTEWEAELRKDEAEIIRRQSKANKEAAVLLRNKDNEIAYAIDTGDFTRLEDMETLLYGLGATEAADEIHKTREVYQIAEPFLSGMAEIPFAQQAAAVDLIFNREDVKRPDNYVVADKVHKKVVANLKKRIDEFAKDPAGMVAKMQTGTDSGQGAQESEHFARNNMNMQTVMAEGAFPNFVPRVLTAAQSNNLKNFLNDDTLSADRKLDELARLYGTYGDLTNRALQESGSPAGVMAAVSLLRDFPGDKGGLAREMLTVSLMKDEDVPKTEITSAEIAEVFSKNDYTRFLREVSAAFPQNQTLALNERGFQDAASRLLKIKGKNALDTLEKNYSFNSSNGIFVRVPKGSLYDAGYVAAGLDLIRSDPKKFAPELTDKQAKVITDTGVWLSSDQSAQLVVNGRVLHTVSLADAVQTKTEKVSVRERERERWTWESMPITGEDL